MNKTGAKLILYSYSRSSCSWRVRSALHHKQLPFETRPVFIYGGEQNEPEFRRVNPGQMVPALVVEEQLSTSDGHHQEEQQPQRTTLFESLAIIDYLEQRYPNPVAPLLPIANSSANLKLRANILAISQMIMSGVQPLQNMAVMQYAADFSTHQAYASSKSKSAERALSWSRHWITAKFARLETLLGPLSGGRYTVGGRLSLSDLCLVPQVYNALHYGVDMSPYPLLSSLYTRLLAEEECIRLGRPEAQPDWDPQREKTTSGF